MTKNFRTSSLFIVISTIFLFFVIINSQISDGPRPKEGDINSYSELIKRARIEKEKLKEAEEEKLETKAPLIPTAPQLAGRFWCDPDIKLNTVRQEVMKNNNYLKYTNKLYNLNLD